MGKVAEMIFPTPRYGAILITSMLVNAVVLVVTLNPLFAFVGTLASFSALESGALPLLPGLEALFRQARAIPV